MVSMIITVGTIITSIIAFVVLTGEEFLKFSLVSDLSIEEKGKKRCQFEISYAPICRINSPNGVMNVTALLRTINFSSVPTFSDTAPIKTQLYLLADSNGAAVKLGSSMLGLNIMWLS